jgi:effector-binding domain-containing protein
LLQGGKVSLKEEPEIVNWPETHYVFVEKVGPFIQTAPEAWQSAHGLVPEILKDNKITGYLSLYKVEEKIYRAGFALPDSPVNLPVGLKYEKFAGGKYSRFVLRGSYSQLPRATGRVFELVTENKIQVRDDFNIENYLNDPRIMPEEQLITEIFIPTA